MLSLIWREIHDNIVHVLGLGVISILTLCGLVYAFCYRIPGAGLAFSGFMLPALLAWFSILGIAQMYGDRTNRISSLLATLAVTRDRILMARVLVGVLMVLGTLLPILLTEILLLRTCVMPLEFHRRMAVEISLTTILTGVACYGIGLAFGWVANKCWLILGSLLSLVLCGSLVAILGCGPRTMLILLVLITAVLACTWLKFTSASL